MRRTVLEVHPPGGVGKLETRKPTATGGIFREFPWDFETTLKGRDAAD